jgi:hypothetical protein
MTRVSDLVAQVYMETLGDLWNEAQGYVEQMAQGAKIRDPAALDIYLRYLILRRGTVEQQFRGIAVLPWTPPVGARFLHPEDLRMLQQDIDDLRVALRLQRSN